jgi:Piwi domain
MNHRVDVFGIGFNTDQYPLSAFKIKSSNERDIGAIYAARVRKIRQLPCAWSPEELRIIAPSSFGQPDATTLLHELQQMKLEGLDVVDDVELDRTWQPSANTIAQFVSRGVLDLARDHLREFLKDECSLVGSITLDRAGLFKGIVVDNQPALQIHIHSPMGTNQSLEKLYKEHGESKVKGMLIKCKDTTGKWARIVGKLGDVIDSSGTTNRQKLQAWKPSDYKPAILDELPDDHLVIALKPEHRKKDYHYPLCVLKPVVEMATLGQFGLSGADIDKVSRKLKIAPEERNRLVKKVRDGVISYLKRFYPAINIDEDYSSSTHPHLFTTARDLQFEHKLRFGKDVAMIERDTDMLASLKKYGLYRKAAAFEDQSEIRIAVLNAIPKEKDYNISRYEQLERYQKIFKELDFTLISSTGQITISNSDGAERRNKITNVLRKLIDSKPHIILIYLPQSERNLSKDDPNSLYNTAKTVCVGAGIPSQIIYEKTVVETKQWADDNIIMGILGKTGNIPYVLAEPLDYLDVIVGLDIARKPKSNGGSTNMAAMSRIYMNNGGLLGYSVIGNAVVQGETIPTWVIEKLFSEDEFSGKRVCIHRDGFFRGEELKTLAEWGKVIKTEFYPVAVIKSGAARMYKDDNGIHQCEKGSVFRVNDSLSYLVSSPPPTGKNRPFSTSQPLQINNHSSLTQEQALRSVLALTLLHYGSVRPPRLPVSTHASDKIAGFLLRNISPDKQKGDVPFWL